MQGALNQEHAMVEDLDGSNLQDTLDVYKYVHTYPHLRSSLCGKVTIKLSAGTLCKRQDKQKVHGAG